MFAFRASEWATLALRPSMWEVNLEEAMGPLGPWPLNAGSEFGTNSWPTRALHPSRGSELGRSNWSTRVLRPAMLGTNLEEPIGPLGLNVAHEFPNSLARSGPSPLNAGNQFGTTPQTTRGHVNMPCTSASRPGGAPRTTASRRAPALTGEGRQKLLRQ